MHVAPRRSMAVLSTTIRVVGALALLTACGPGGPTGDEQGDGNQEIGSTASQGTAGADTTETGLPEPMCTVENYADHPDLLDITAVGCVPAPDDADCPPCVGSCATTIVNCSGLSVCYGHTTLCTEEIGSACCYLITAEQDAVGFVG